jgi:hypothetical protein
MSRSFYEVEFEGNYDTISSFLKEKINCITHPYSNNKLFIEINFEDKDELMFFNNSSMEDSISKIFKVLKYKRNSAYYFSRIILF